MKYLISFPASAMVVSEGEWEAVGRDSHAVIEEAKNAGVYVFGGGIDESVPPVLVSADGTFAAGGYPWAPPLNGGFLVLELPTREDAIAWAARIAKGCHCRQELRVLVLIRLRKMLNLYNKHILPKYLDRAMRPAAFNETRSRIVAPAHGTILEIGFGSGFNLPFYKNVTKLYAIDPSRELFEYAKDRIAAVPFSIEYMQCSAESIPLADGSVDFVVSTWSLCSIPDVSRALKEARRVLKPGGKFLFVEHGRSPKKLNSLVQVLATPIARHFMGNCHLDRKMDDLITAAGFTMESIETFPEEGRPLMFSYRGVAAK